MGEDSSVDEESADATGRRRLLIKAAVGAGVAVAAHSVPKVSVVPAYAATASTAGSGGSGVYGIAYDSNRDGDVTTLEQTGWLEPSDAEYDFLTTSDQNGGPFTGTPSGIEGPTGGSRGSYTYSHGLGNFTLIATGCVSGNAGNFEFSGIPSGYKVQFFSDGRPLSSNNDNVTGDVAAGGDQTTNSGTLSTFANATLNDPFMSLDSFYITNLGNGTCGYTGFYTIRWTFQLVTV